MREPRRPLGPLFSPTRSSADGLFQRSLLGLLSSTPTLRLFRVAIGLSEAHDLGATGIGTELSTPDRGWWCQVRKRENGEA
jgi:hypothetical protein